MKNKIIFFNKWLSIGFLDAYMYLAKSLFLMQAQHKVSSQDQVRLALSFATAQVLHKTAMIFNVLKPLD